MIKNQVYTRKPIHISRIATYLNFAGLGRVGSTPIISCAFLAVHRSVELMTGMINYNQYITIVRIGTV